MHIGGMCLKIFRVERLPGAIKKERKKYIYIYTYVYVYIYFVVKKKKSCSLCSGIFS